jgi:3-hydroxyisobutyrate dehydrogenase
MFETLADIQADIAQRISQAAKDRKSPMHVPVVVTSDVDARVMVLRAYDAETRTLRFHTDARAPKVAAIAADPAMAVLFYDKQAKIQIRAKGIGRIETDSIAAQRAWEASENFARRCYLGDGPGTASDSATSGLPAEFEGVEPNDEQLIPARENFAVLMIELREFDWFYLAHTGHIRAQFSVSEGGEWTSRWVSP